MMAIEMGLQTLLAGQKLNLLETCKKLRDQRMHGVQVEVQYVYVAAALCEYGKAMGYWNDPELIDQYQKFKTTFDEHVARLPPPDAAVPQQAVLLARAAIQNQQVPENQPLLQGQPQLPLMVISPAQEVAAPAPPLDTQLANKEGIRVESVENRVPPPLLSAGPTPALQPSREPPRLLQAVPGPTKVLQSIPEQTRKTQHVSGPPRLQSDCEPPLMMRPGSISQDGNSISPAAAEQCAAHLCAATCRPSACSSLRKCKSKKSIDAAMVNMIPSNDAVRDRQAQCGRQPVPHSVYINLK
ncbi:unnamed protein product [Angiostrongylus costaricensis]|uniref:Tyrosine-protein phosphatase domain-containing protein n=1 Tax=Angiostrongylus costaricensis TaxID=334426 RepID=A0A0R3PMM0_ANGCS|nr:unnamed protein product [Angiostrongylus costaricensis]